MIDTCRAELAKPGLLDESTRGLVLFYLGLAQTRAGDAAAGTASFREGCQFMETQRQVAPDDPYTVAYAALLHAATGNASAATSEDDHAVQLAEHDAMLRPRMELIHAQVHALLGEIEPTLRELQSLLATPGKEITPELLRLDPVWDSLRNDPRFQKLCEDGRPQAPGLATDVNRATTHMNLRTIDMDCAAIGVNRSAIHVKRLTIHTDRRTMDTVR